MKIVIAMHEMMAKGFRPTRSNKNVPVSATSKHHAFRIMFFSKLVVPMTEIIKMATYDL